MLQRKMFSRLFVVVLLAGVQCVAHGQNYPYRPIRIITSNIGGGNDFVARLIAQGISGSLGQQIVVENRAIGVIPGEAVAKSQPDGYTLLLAGGSHWIAPLIQNTPYDPVKDYAPISIADKAPLILVVHPAVAAGSVKELIAVAKAKPGALNYASTATGSMIHLSAELFKSMAGVNIVRIPYKGAAPAVSDLLAGQTQMMFVAALTVAPHAKSGKLRALAVSSLEPTALAPGLPTVAASGLPGFEAMTLSAVFAPVGTPRVIVARLNRELVHFLGTAEAREKLFSTGSEAASSSPEQLAAAIKSDMTRLGKLIKDAGIRAD
jgi:tripartite-type tricarboxylate transporter receptor subunit TctC